MGLKLSRKIRSLREKILEKIKKSNIFLYNFLIFIGAFFKFISKINRKKSFKKYSNYLDDVNNFEYRKTSQNNEDGLIDYIFTKLNIKKLNFIEIGFDYFENNSLNLFNKVNKGLFIDGDDKKVFLMKNILKIIYPLKKIHVDNKLINKDNINLLISKTFVKNEEFVFLSIDVDGIDYFLFKEISIRPKLICIEYNFWFGKDAKCSVPYNKDFKWTMGSLYSGASLSALNSLANSKEYYLIALDSSCVNAFFIRGDLKDNFAILDPFLSFKVPSKYNEKDIENERQKLLKQNLVHF